MSLTFWETENTAVHIFNNFFFFSSLRRIFNILKEGGKNIMQLCSQSYSQVDYWDLTKTAFWWSVWRDGVRLMTSTSLFMLQAQSQDWKERSMEKPPVNLSYWHMMLTTLKKKSWMKKNFSTYPKETAADQSSVRRLSLVDRRYVFSISVSLAAKEMNKSAAFCPPSPWGQT